MTELPQGIVRGGSGQLRKQMPGVTVWIDSLREAFGKEMVDQMIRTGLREGTFWAVENGLVVGQPPTEVLDKHFADLNNPASPVEEVVPPPLPPSIDRHWPV